MPNSENASRSIWVLITVKLSFQRQRNLIKSSALDFYKSLTSSTPLFVVLTTQRSLFMTVTEWWLYADRKAVSAHRPANCAWWSRIFASLFQFGPHDKSSRSQTHLQILNLRQTFLHNTWNLSPISFSRSCLNSKITRSNNTEISSNPWDILDVHSLIFSLFFLLLLSYKQEILSGIFIWH